MEKFMGPYFEKKLEYWEQFLEKSRILEVRSKFLMDKILIFVLCVMSKKKLNTFFSIT